ncbi:Pentalenene synthase [Termitomyces sp. T112]|nr:Pentalenene synthase [Termitomyces sp. T112]
MSYDSGSVFILPDPLAEWPWKRNISPHYLQTQAESSAWIRSFNGLPPHVQRALHLGEFELLASLAYSLESKDVIRAGCDYIILFALFDEYSDVMTPHEVRQLAMMVMDALQNPDKARPAGECVLGEIARQFWQSSLKFASEGARRRFIKGFDEYTTKVVEEAQDRVQDLIRNIDDYILFRRSAVGMKATYVFIEFSLDLPDESFEHPIIQRLTDTSSDLIWLINDMYSYNVEQARGENHNIVASLMHHKNIGVNEAMEWVGDYCSKLTRNFLNDLRDVPSFGEELDGQVQHYLNGLAYCVRGNDSWSFETRRYFVEGGLDIQKTRRVVLLPRRNLQINEDVLDGVL